MDRRSSSGNSLDIRGLIRETLEKTLMVPSDPGREITRDPLSSFRNSSLDC